MDLDSFWHFIRASAGHSFLWDTCGPNIFRGDFHDSFALELACKDIRLFSEMAKDVEVRFNFYFTIIYYLLTIDYYLLRHML